MRTIIQEAPTGAFVAMVLVPLAMAALAVYAGLAARRQARIVNATPVTRIGMAEDGYRTFEGTAQAIGGQTLNAPLTGSECVWFSARVEQRTQRRSARSDHSTWTAVRELTSTAPVLVRDATGACIVRVHRADVTPCDKSRWTGSSLEPEDRNPPRLGPLDPLDSMVQVTGWSDHQFRYTEMRIYPGDQLMVTGLFASHRFDAEPPDLDALPPDPSIAPDWTAAGDDTGPEAADAAGAPARAARNTPALTWHAANAERTETLTALATARARAEVTAGRRDQPLLVAAMPAGTYAYMSEVGAQAAFAVALVPLGIAVLVLLARFR